MNVSVCLSNEVFEIQKLYKTTQTCIKFDSSL